MDSGSLTFVQVPHHGSRHNVDAALLDRMLGPIGWRAPESLTAFVSASELDEDHPHVMVLNAFRRRGCYVVATEGSNKWHYHDAPARANYTAVPQLEVSGGA